ncbi:MAG: AsmA family protein, partial [Alcaligenaceae bacterium]|nr:AsmA family protein [Alcaligenaceae bacterium]
IAGLLGTSNGELSLALSRGTISRFLMEAAGLNIANVIFVKLFGDEQVMLECLVADFAVKEGVMQTRLFVLETEDAIVTMEGSVSLKNETLNLDIRPQNKTLRIFTLRSPLYAKGSFKHPDVGVQAGPVAARAGAAVALGVIATPLAALVPLLNVGSGDDHACSALGEKED